MSTKVWYRDDSKDNLDRPHKTDPPRYLSLEELYKKTGLKYEKIPDAVCEDPRLFQALPAERNYTYNDCIVVDKEERKFSAEHLHEDPEVRLILSGGGYFEVRTLDDEWIRFHVQKGDLIQLPPGVWHRFNMDQQNHVKLLRLFSEIPEWKAEYREMNPDPPARNRYRDTMATIA